MFPKPKEKAVKSAKCVKAKFILASDRESSRNVRDVSVAGTFNNWTPTSLKRKYRRWETSLQVVPGSHQYRFIVDGQWRHDHKKPKVENDVGSHNNIMTVFKGATSTEISSSCLKMRKKPIEKSGGVEVREKGGVTNGEKEEEKELKDTQQDSKNYAKEEAAGDIVKDLLNSVVEATQPLPIPKMITRPPFSPIDPTTWSNFSSDTHLRNFSYGESFSAVDDPRTMGWKVGDLCVAQWRGRYWYNCEILEIVGDQVLVKYLDYLDIDYADIKDLKEAGCLDEDGFLKETEVGNGITWGEEVTFGPSTWGTGLNPTEENLVPDPAVMKQGKSYKNMERRRNVGNSRPAQ